MRTVSRAAGLSTPKGAVLKNSKYHYSTRLNIRSSTVGSDISADP